jgi:hypothetical protein
MEIVEQIKTSKGAYSLTMQIRDDDTAIVSLADPERETFIRLDRADLERIHLLLEDHIVYNGKDGSL